MKNEKVIYPILVFFNWSTNEMEETFFFLVFVDLLSGFFWFNRAGE